MQERLLQIGEWLKVYGEAIYGTSRWKTPYQVSEGLSGYRLKKDEDPMLKLTVDPEKGYAVREVFYTYNAARNSLYAIFPKFPGNKQLQLKNVSLLPGTKITFLGTQEDLQWKQVGEDFLINLPEYDPNKMQSYAYAIKITGYGAYLAKPSINVDYKKGVLVPTVSMNGGDRSVIRYTTDNTEPTEQSMLYLKPFNLYSSGIVKAKSFEAAKLPSATSEYRVIKYEWKKALKPMHTEPGIEYKYFEPATDINIGSVSRETVVKSGITPGISIEPKVRKEKFAFEFKGLIKIPRDGFYNFFIESDDGSKLFLDEMEIVNNDGDHGMLEKSGRAVLKKGFHKIKILYYDSGGDNGLKVSVQFGNGNKEEVPANILFH
jgi:hypothetical protein